MGTRKHFVCITCMLLHMCWLHDARGRKVVDMMARRPYKSYLEPEAELKPPKRTRYRWNDEQHSHITVSLHCLPSLQVPSLRGGEVSGIYSQYSSCVIRWCHHHWWFHHQSNGVSFLGYGHGGCNRSARLSLGVILLQDVPDSHGHESLQHDESDLKFKFSPRI